MAISAEQKEGKLILTLDNGDLERLNAVVSRWNFIDYQGLIRFMCSIMTDTKENKLYMEGSNGPFPVVPAAKLLEKDTGKEPEKDPGKEPIVNQSTTEGK